MVLTHCYYISFPPLFEGKTPYVSKWASLIEKDMGNKNANWNKKYNLYNKCQILSNTQKKFPPTQICWLSHMWSNFSILSKRSVYVLTSPPTRNMLDLEVHKDQSRISIVEFLFDHPIMTNIKIFLFAEKTSQVKFTHIYEN